MPDDEDQDGTDEFRDMLRDFLAGNSGIDAAGLAKAAGLPEDPEVLARLMSQLQGALQNSSEGIDWGVATRQAKALAAPATTEVTDSQRTELEQALALAALWLSEATAVGEQSALARLMTRTEWIGATMPIWQELSEPVASSIADALTDVVEQNVPEEMGGFAGAGKLMRNLGGTLFAIQLGQVVGQLSADVVSGGDIGIPLLETPAVIPQNIEAFGEGLEIDADQIRLYLSVRELAHARLFRHARWLRLHLLSAIGDFARGIRVDSDRITDLAERFDPENPEDLREALVSGQLIPPKSEAQLAALARLETMLALIEGWVDVVTLQATQRLPKAGAIAETVRRRRASGGPAESAFATLVGLELRPRRLREAAAMWTAITEEVGAEQRDALWFHPDLVPGPADLDDPTALLARLKSPAPEFDEMDQALEDLLNQEDK